MHLLNNLQWRYATKQFDTTKTVSQDHILLLQQAIQLSPSSYGLQLYKVLIIENPEVKKTLKAHSWNQDQITDASHLFVFCNYVNVTDAHIDIYLEHTSKLQNTHIDHLKGYGDFMKSKIAELSNTERLHWTKRQTYLALGNLLNACAELKIDACPMEGFQAEAYNEVLGLTDQNLNAAVIAPIGYRSSNDESQYNTKVRKPLSELFTTI